MPGVGATTTPPSGPRHMRVRRTWSRSLELGGKKKRPLRAAPPSCSSPEPHPTQPTYAQSPYRLLRHPSYSGLLLILLGLGLMLGTWLGLAALIVLPLIGMLIRIRVEESVLTGALGQEYVSYAAETKRLIPGAW